MKSPPTSTRSRNVIMGSARVPRVWFGRLAKTNFLSTSQLSSNRNRWESSRLAKAFGVASTRDARATQKWKTQRTSTSIGSRWFIIYVPRSESRFAAWLRPNESVARAISVALPAFAGVCQTNSQSRHVFGFDSPNSVAFDHVDPPFALISTVVISPSLVHVAP